MLNICACHGSEQLTFISLCKLHNNLVTLIFFFLNESNSVPDLLAPLPLPVAFEFYWPHSMVRNLFYILCSDPAYLHRHICERKHHKSYPDYELWTLIFSISFYFFLSRFGPTKSTSGVTDSLWPTDGQKHCVLGHMLAMRVLYRHNINTYMYTQVRILVQKPKHSPPNLHSFSDLENFQPEWS